MSLQKEQLVKCIRNIPIFVKYKTAYILLNFKSIIEIFKEQVWKKFSDDSLLLLISVIFIMCRRKYIYMLIYIVNMKWVEILNWPNFLSPIQGQVVPEESPFRKNIMMYTLEPCLPGIIFFPPLSVNPKSSPKYLIT